MGFSLSFASFLFYFLLKRERKEGINTLLMIRLVVYDLEAAVDLLQEHYTEYLVGEGGLAEAEPEVCHLKHLGGKAE